MGFFRFFRFFRFFKRHCIFILALALILVLTSCFAGRKNNDGKGLNVQDPMLYSINERSGEPFDWNLFRDREISSFRIMKVNANVNTNTNYINKETEQHEAVAVDFAVVLEHKGTSQRLLGHRFRVSGYHGEEVYNLEVQENNIISWTEVIEFDSLKPQFNPVLVVKKIEGLGGSTGYTHAVFELNPWAYFYSELGRAFFDLTYSVDVLKARYSKFDPSFNYVQHLQDPQTTSPRLNISSAKFYINTVETKKLMSDISSVEPLKMYEPSSLEKKFEKEKVPILIESKSTSDIDRGDLKDQPDRQYMTRDEITNNFVDSKKITPRGVKLKLGANLTLKTEVSNGGATTIFNTIKSGKFKVFAALIGSNHGLYDDLGDEEKILLGINTSPVVGEIESQILKVEFDMFIGSTTNRGDLDLALKIIPLQQWAQAGLEPFSVVYKLGTYDDLLGHSGDFRDPSANLSDFKYDKYVKNISDFTDHHKQLLFENGFTSEIRKIIFDSMSIKFRTVKAGETATQRTVIFDVKSCPRENLSGKSIGKGRQFRILVSGLDPLKCTPEDYILPDGKKNPACRFSKVPIEKIRKDGGNGVFSVKDTNCLAWVDEIAHKYYQRENLIERSYHIIDPLTNKEIFKLDGYFNPWDEKFGTLGVDARNLSDSFIKEIKSREKLPSRFFVGDFSYMTLRFRYDIDENMNLTVKKTVLLNLYPFVKRYSNIINGINGNFPIRDGIYLLKVAYQKDYIDPGARGIDLRGIQDGKHVKTRVFVEDGRTGAKRHSDPFFQNDLRRKTFVYVIKKLIRVENNRIITPVEFHINELRTLRVRSNLLLQLEPVNQYKLQIVNLLERHVARKLGLEIGNLGAVRCLNPDILDDLLDRFQRTIDQIALSIPDNHDYNSKDSFKNVIRSAVVANALSDLTDNSLLDGLDSALSLALNEQQMTDALELSGETLTGLKSTEELENAIKAAKAASALSAANAASAASAASALNAANAASAASAANAARKDSLLEKQKSLGILDQLSNQASKALVADPDDEKLRSHEGFLTPLNSGSLNNLTPQAKAEAPIHVLGTDAEDKHTHMKAFLKEVTNDQDLQRLLKNDFTIDPAIARVSDLDYLIDRKSGIIRRTFIGPLTLLALDNKNVMNATDALDYESSSNDGAQEQSIKNSYKDDFNSDYARNPNFGYQGHFKNCHVDDFIVNDQHEELIHDAWAECVAEFKDSSGKIKIPEDYPCDYEKTEAYENYLRSQTNKIWRDVEKYDSSPFKRFARHSDEKKLVNEGRCPYREVWFKKYFSQKMIQKAQAQFGNFLSFPSVTAKVVQPIREDSDHNLNFHKPKLEPMALKVNAIKKECIEQGRIRESCIDTTNRFNLSVSEISDSILRRGDYKNTDKNTDKNVRDYFVDPRREFDDTAYKPVLEEFYSKYSKLKLKSLADRGEEAVKELSKDIYKTLVHIAAPPPSKSHPQVIDYGDDYEDKLNQIAPADFGRDVQSFLCNIMLPRANQSFHTLFKWLDELDEGDLEKLKVEDVEGLEQSKRFEDFVEHFKDLKEKKYFDFHKTLGSKIGLEDGIGLIDRAESIDLNDKRGVLYDKFKRALNQCHVRANSESVEVALPFQIERKFKTLELGRYFFRGGKSVNFLTNQAVGVSHSLNVTNKYTLDPVNSLKDVIKNALGDLLTLGPVADLLGGAFKFHDYAQSEINGVSDSKGLVTGAHLSMQTAELDLELLRYKRCMLVRWSKDFLDNVLDDDIHIFKTIIPAMNNIFICGFEENEAVAIRENYYYVSQHFTEGDMLDTGSLLNNPWLLILRGYRDMIAFVRALYPSSKYSDNSPNVINLIKDDWDRLTTERPVFVPVSLRYESERQTYEQEVEPLLIMSMAYRNITPSFPGFFTQLNNKEASLPVWPWTNEGQLKGQTDKSCNKELQQNNKMNQDGDEDEENKN